MSEAREAILGRLRQAFGRGDGGAVGAAAVTERLEARRRNLVPARADLDVEGRLDLFRAQAEAVQTTVERVEEVGALPVLIAGFLRRHNLPPQTVVADDPALRGLGWDEALIEAERGRAAREEDPVGVTVALAGVAETGTVMLRSSAATPTSLAFLPDTAIIALARQRVLGSYEDALALLREEGALPRSVNFVTGPSRTADIEQTLQLGAHGPRRLLVVLVDRMPEPGTA
jgi:L-lactate dehydrogenase complex protein LldG